MRIVAKIDHPVWSCMPDWWEAVTEAAKTHIYDGSFVPKIVIENRGIEYVTASGKGRYVITPARFEYEGYRQSFLDGNPFIVADLYTSADGGCVEECDILVSFSERERFLVNPAATLLSSVVIEWESSRPEDFVRLMAKKRQHR